jgi:hypothetical protein
VANPNPYKARLAKALRHKPGDIDGIMRRAWAVLCLAYDEIAEAPDGEARRKGMVTFAQLAGVYARLYELHTIEADLAALERRVGLAEGNGNVE